MIFKNYLTFFIIILGASVLGVSTTFQAILDSIQLFSNILVNISTSSQVLTATIIH